MNGRPTPETDATTSRLMCNVSADFARKLKYERDDARNKMADALQEVDLRTLDFERMKQERDEAREDLEFRRGLYKVQEEYLETARRERDEAREQLSAAKREAEYLATSIHRAEYSNVVPNWGLCDSLAGVISQIDNMYAGVREMRDEAREELLEQARLLGISGERECRLIAERDELKRKYDIEATEHMLNINKCCNQRDEAINALMKIEEIFIDGDDTYEDWKSMGQIARTFLEKTYESRTF